MTDLSNIEKIIEGLSAFNAATEVSNIIDNNNDVIVELQREQLIEGKDKTGKSRSDSYAPLTISIKKQYGVGPGAITDRVTFFMTGTLSYSLFYSRTGDTYSILSPLETYKKMLDRIGEDKYGLDPENRLYFAENILLPKFGEVFKEKTTLHI